MRRDPPIPLDDLADALDLALREGFDLEVDGEVFRVRELRRRRRPARPEASPSPRPARRPPRPEPKVAVEVEEKTVPLKLASQVPEDRTPAPPPRSPPPPRPRAAPVDLSEEKLREVLALAPGGARLDLLAQWFSVPATALRPALDALVRAGLLVRPEEGSYALNE